MLWLGPFTKTPLSIYRTNVRTRELRRIKKANMDYILPNYSCRQSTHFYFPDTWDLVILKKNSQYCYFFSSTYYFMFTLPPLSIQITPVPHSSSLYFFTQVKSIDFFTVVKLLNLVLLSFTKLFFVKLKFRGKGYYLYKSLRSTITPQFGYAHRIYKYNYITTVKFLSKTKVFFYGTSKSDILRLSYSLKIIRPVNIFTGRGMRFAKTVIYRKTGKVSSYR